MHVRFRAIFLALHHWRYERPSWRAVLLAGPMVLVHPASVLGAVAAVPDVDGAALGLAWGLPFVGILLSIALTPLLASKFWHHHFGKISAFWAAAFLIPFTAGASFTDFRPGHTAAAGAP